MNDAACSVFQDLINLSVRMMPIFLCLEPKQKNRETIAACSVYLWVIMIFTQSLFHIPDRTFWIFQAIFSCLFFLLLLIFFRGSAVEKLFFYLSAWMLADLSSFLNRFTAWCFHTLLPWSEEQLCTLVSLLNASLCCLFVHFWMKKRAREIFGSLSPRFSLLLAAYPVYLWYYPYIYIETTTKKGEEQALQMPCLGAAAAILLCLGVAQTFNYDSGVYFKITFALTVLLALPYLIKSAKTKLPQRLGRKLSVIFAAFILAFSITFPLNFLLTFDKARHETVTITDKHISTSGKTDDYYLHGYWNGEETKFRVSSSVYRDTDIGEERRICIRQSALGMVYYSIHR